MGNVILILLGIVAVLLLLAFIKAKSSTGAAGDTTRYYRKAVLSDVEQVLFQRLREALPDVVVLAQVALPAMIGLKKPVDRDYWALFNAIRAKHVDFVICNADFSVRAVVELDDGTHEREDRKKSDHIKNGAFAATGMPLIRFNVRQMPSVEQIRTALGEGAKLQESGSVA